MHISDWLGSSSAKTALPSLPAVAVHEGIYHLRAEQSSGGQFPSRANGESRSMGCSGPLALGQGAPVQVFLQCCRVISTRPAGLSSGTKTAIETVSAVADA